MKNQTHRMGLGPAGLGLTLGLMIWSGPAAASDLGQRVAIDSFRGPQGAVLQDAVESALLRRYFLVPDAQVVAAARKSGVRLRSDEDFAEVGRSLNVAAFVSATVKRHKNWQVEMVVRNGETGETVARYDLTDRRLEALAATVARSTPRRLQVLLASARTSVAEADDAEPQVRTKLRPPAPRAKGRDQAEDADDNEKPAAIDRRASKDKGKAKARDKDEVEAETSDETPDGPGDELPRPYLELGVGGKVFSRSMSFTENFSNVPAYRLDRATAVTVDMAIHPFAMSEATKDAWLAGLGLTGSVTYAMGITTEQTGADGRARTEVHGYEVGLRYRAALGPVDLIPRGSYIGETFVANVGALSPDVNYQVMRLGMGIQLALSRHAFMRAGADYLHVLSAGRLNDPDRFPRAVTRGVDVSLGAGYAFTDSIEAFLSVGLRRYGYDMKVQQGDALIAGGAVDEYLSMTTGLTYRPSLGGR